MSSAEIKLKKKLRNSKIQKVVLNTLYSAGILSIALAMPNLLSLLKHLDPQKKGSRPSSVNTAIKRLREKGLIVWEKKEKGIYLRLTKEGGAYIRIN